MAYKMVIALFLPKGAARHRQHRVSPFTCDAFQRFRQFRQCYAGSRQKMNVVRHDRDGWLTQVERPNAGLVQQAIHRGKRLSGVEGCRREIPMGGQTVTQAPGEEDGPVSLIIVRKPALVESHTRMVRREWRISHQRAGRPGGRTRTWGPPHQGGMVIAASAGAPSHAAIVGGLGPGTTAAVSKTTLS